MLACQVLHCSIGLFFNLFTLSTQDLSFRNRLVASLPSSARGQMLQHSELVELPITTALSAPLDCTDHAYFPIDCFVSVVLPVSGEADMEIALVGNEGMFNIDTVFGANSSCFGARVMGPGRALKIHKDALRMRRAEDATLRQLLFRYMDVRACQTAQKAACMTRHTVQQRLARTLLMLRDRAFSTELFLTHESLAVMLGVRRESVSQAARCFQKRGLISYGRAYLVLLEEQLLERAACSCYQSDLDIYGRALQAED